MVKRIVYIPYYFLNTPVNDFLKLLKYAHTKKNVSPTVLIFDIFFCSIKYNISFMDYFSFRFFEIEKKERKDYIGSGAMYEFQLQMNPRKHRFVLHNKIEFLQKFNDLCGRKWATIKGLSENAASYNAFINGKSNKIVLKYSRGQSGMQVEICNTSSLNIQDLLKKMKKGGFDLIEEYIIQHDLIAKISPSAVNTIRIVTQLCNNEVEIITCCLRISVNSHVDNASAGNMVAPLSPITGRVVGPAIYADITKADELIHPITGIDLLNIEVPFWADCIELVKKAAKRIPENRSIGWDVAITNTGPILVEGNHNWNYLVLQMPDKKGHKGTLLRYL